MNIKKLAGISLACSAIALSAAPAQAGLVLSLTDGSSTVTIADGGGGDSNTNANVVTWLGALGSWSINVSTALSFAPNGEAGIDLNSVDYSTGAGNLWISMWTNAADFTSPPAGPSSMRSDIGGTIGGGTGSSVSVAGFINNGTPGALPAGGTWTPVIGQGPFAPTAFSGSTHAPVTIGGGFDLGQVVAIAHAAAGATSFDSSIAVPEPSILVLLGLGLLGFGFARRRRAS